MATNKRSISEGSDEKGSSRVGGEAVDSSTTNKRPSGEMKTDDAKRQKITFGIGTKQSAGKDKSKDVRENTKPGIQIKLGTHKSNIPIAPVKSRPKAAIFNSDSEDEEPEEMPPEAKMRMRNIGRDTPTSAGPNSFGKTKQGFCDSKKVFEKSLKAAIEKAGND